MKTEKIHIEFGIQPKLEKGKHIVILSVREESLLNNKETTQDPSRSFRMTFFNTILT
ncbi:hypothetical protein IKI14_01945 [bacterium]|nr:hypothetical protein [bacterium]